MRRGGSRRAHVGTGYKLQECRVDPGDPREEIRVRDPSLGTSSACPETVIPRGPSGCKYFIYVLTLVAEEASSAPGSPTMAPVWARPPRSSRGLLHRHLPSGLYSTPVTTPTWAKGRHSCRPLPVPRPVPQPHQRPRL